jgi:hypothetical protein
MIAAQPIKPIRTNQEIINVLISSQFTLCIQVSIVPPFVG